MKYFCLIALLLAAHVETLRAQTSTNAATRSVRTQTFIDSKRVFFSNTTRQIIYSGNVRVDDPQMKLTCDQLTADFPQAGGHIDHLVALTNVVMDSTDEKGQTTHATGDTAIYDYKVQDGVTNEVVTLTGNARAENAKMILYGEPITYDRTTGSLTAVNQHMIIKQNLASVLNTNAPAAKTNFPPVPTVPSIRQITNALVVKTNSPPAVVQFTNPPVMNLPITSTNLPPAKIQNVSPKSPRQS